jgi:GNAT superfamily N-acetyltransferase
VTVDLARLRVRPVGPDDLRLLATNLVAGIETYRSFAPPGWQPPTVEHEMMLMAPRLERGAWGRAAFDGGDVAGHVLFVPAAGLPGVAHLGGLFVAPSWWGSGLAARLLADAVAEMRAQGFAQGRLFTPELQARARRFYEREGWRVQPGRLPEPGLGLDLVEYRRRLRAERS